MSGDLESIPTASEGDVSDQARAAVLMWGSAPISGHRWVVSRQVVEIDRTIREQEGYPIAAKISCVVVDSNGVAGSFIDSALK